MGRNASVACRSNKLRARTSGISKPPRAQLDFVPKKVNASPSRKRRWKAVDQQITRSKYVVEHAYQCEQQCRLQKLTSIPLQRRGLQNENLHFDKAPIHAPASHSPGTPLAAQIKQSDDSYEEVDMKKTHLQQSQGNSVKRHSDWSLQSPLKIDDNRVKMSTHKYAYQHNAESKDQ
jgi:hypothetical protein